MRTPRITLLALTVVAALSSACHTPAPPPPSRQIDVEWSDPTSTFPRSIRLHVSVQGPDGTHYQKTGTMSQGGTTRALCRSLKGSLGAIGCEASYRDAGAAEDPLARAMHQIIELPEGWRVVYAQPHVQVPKGEDMLKVQVNRP